MFFSDNTVVLIRQLHLRHAGFGVLLVKNCHPGFELTEGLG